MSMRKPQYGPYLNAFRMSKQSSASMLFGVKVPIISVRKLCKKAVIATLKSLYKFERNKWIYRMLNPESLSVFYPNLEPRINIMSNSRFPSFFHPLQNPDPINTTNPVKDIPWLVVFVVPMLHLGGANI